MPRAVLLLVVCLPALTSAQAVRRPRPRVHLTAATADLESNDLERARRALAALGASGAARAVEPLAVFVRRGPPGALLLPAIDALGALGRREAADALVPLLRHRRPDVRARTAVALAPLRSEEVSSALVVALGDPDEAVRSAAAQALVTAGTPAAVEPLFRALEAGNRAAAPAVGAAGVAADCDRLLGMTDRVELAAVLPAFRLFLLRRDVPERERLAFVDRLAGHAAPEVRGFLESLWEEVPRNQRRLRDEIGEAANAQSGIRSSAQ